MASVGHSIVNEETHNNLNGHVSSVRDVLSLVTPSSSVSLDSLKRITSIRAVMTSAPFRTAVIAVIMSGKGKAVTPIKWSHRLGCLDLPDRLFPGCRAFLSS